MNHWFKGLQVLGGLPMKLQINGQWYELDVGTLADVIEHFNLQSGLVVTELDGAIINRSEWDETELVDDMKIELVQFVGGG